MSIANQQALVDHAAASMVDRLWSEADVALRDDSLSRQDRAGYIADQRLKPLHQRLVGLGWIVETYTHGSVYYSRGAERLRLSNHEVPRTSEREDAARHGRWSWDRCGWQVITTRSLDALHGEIDEIEEALAEDDQ